MTVRLRMLLEPEEYARLEQLAEKEVRSPEAQARYILRKELERLGLLTAPDLATAEHSNGARELAIVGDGA